MTLIHIRKRLFRRLPRIACLVLLLLASCAKNTTDQASTITIDQHLAIATSTSSPTLQPSRAPRPSRTPRSILPRSPSTPLPTQLAGLVDRYRCSQDISNESPSKEWAFFYDCYDSHLGYSAILINQFTGEYWNYTYCKYYNQCVENPGEGHIAFEAWSPDGNYLYATLTTGGDGGPWFGYSLKLLSINLHNKIASIFIDLSAEYEFSPGGDKLAYIPYVGDFLHFEYKRNEPFAVCVHDLKDSDEFKLIIEYKYDEAGDIAWSPDGTQFVFLAIKYNDSYDIESSTIVLVDVVSKRLEILIKDHPGYLDFQEWEPDGILIYRVDSTEEMIYYSIPERQMVITPTS
jgi:hypothetical protein